MSLRTFYVLTNNPLTPNLGRGSNSFTTIMKHKLFLLLAVIGMMLPQMASAYDFEVGGIYYDDIGGNNVAVTYRNTSSNSYSGSVVIPSTVTYSGTTYNVTSIGYRAFADCSGLTSVTIGSSVTSIRGYAFEGCSSVKELIYADGCTTALRTGLKSITSVTITQKTKSYI